MISIDDQKRVVNAVDFLVGNADDGGWVKPSYCSRKDLYFLHAEAQRRGARETKCWGLHPVSMGAPTATAPNHVKEFYQYVAKHGLKLPQTAIISSFYRSSASKYLQAAYARNPEVDGFAQSASSLWQKETADEKRRRYLEDVKAWTERWYPTFEAAFNGRPITQGTIISTMAPSPISQGSMEKQLEELKIIFEKKLITDDEYAARKKTILNLQ